ncbi:MAG: hypothetical protein HVK24_00020 [Pelagibacteraceae bacterium]|nr:hypothetical protein [Pelagibacteraceae bacterium]
MKTLTNTALTHKEGGGTGFNFSIVPPKGMQHEGITSPGAVITINNIDVETETICQGNRRGANMAVLNYNNPDVIDFIYAKRDRREVRDKATLQAKMLEMVSTLFDRMKLDYNQSTLEEELTEVEGED